MSNPTAASHLPTLGSMSSMTNTVYGMEEGRDESLLHQQASSTLSSSSGGSLLAAVSCAEDRLLIMDVLNAIRMCRHPHTQLCTSWSVHPNQAGTGYTLTAYLPKYDPATSPVEVTHDDLSLIESVNLLRVKVGVCQLNAETWALKVHIASHKAPISFTVHDTMRFTKRKSLLVGPWFSSSSSTASAQQGHTSTQSTKGGTAASFFQNIFSKNENKFSVAAKTQEAASSNDINAQVSRAADTMLEATGNNTRPGGFASEGYSARKKREREDGNE